MSVKSIAFAAVMALAAGVALAAEAPAFISSAVNDSARPAADRARDAARKPAEMLQFAQIKQGHKIAELIPGGGYFTRIFSKAVGPNGKVYVVGTPGAVVNVNGVTGNAAYANVTSVTSAANSLNLPEQVDVVWTSLNYHDMKNPPRGGGAPIDMAAFNRAVYNALKPGGYYIIIDHSANTGDATATSTLHRIDQVIVANEVAAAGFLKQSESQALRNPADPRTGNSESVNRLTDQFVMLFRKPDLTMGGAIRN